MLRAGLPVVNGLYGRPLRWRRQVDDVECQVVANHNGCEDLEYQRKRHDISGTRPRCDEDLLQGAHRVTEASDFESSPDAYAVKIDQFEGPLDLLIHLIHAFNLRNLILTHIPKHSSFEAAETEV